MPGRDGAPWRKASSVQTAGASDSIGIKDKQCRALWPTKYVVQLPAGKTLTATMTPNSTSDYDLYIYNSSGTQLSYSENGTGSVDTATSSNTGSTTVARYVRVVYYAGGTGSTSGKYTLKLTW